MSIWEKILKLLGLYSPEEVIVEKKPAAKKKAAPKKKPVKKVK
jgi:hypothetical protein